ncbi:MAG: signal peptidase II, partial [Calditrichaceae bacterium]|nr:signal peptidase II [Calditrichaceae bacterium]
ALSNTKMKRWILIMIIIAAVITADQITKELAREYLADSPTISYLGNLFLLHYAENDGAFLSMGSNWPAPLRMILLTIIPVIFLFILLFVVLFSREMDIWTTIAFALILGGGLSNMWDRLVNNGFVVDFMNMGIGSLRTGIFNVADMAITTAFFMIVIHMIMQRIKHKKTDI